MTVLERLLSAYASARAVALSESPETASGRHQIRSRLAFKYVDWQALIFWALPAVALGLMPLLLWTGAFGKLMNLGGDDSHLMYAYPDRWLVHASLPVFDQNLGGYNPRTYFVPFTILLLATKSLGLNAQGLFFGLALAFTYLGVAWLVLELIGRKDFTARACAGFAGAVVVCAPLIAETQWTGLLTAIYWEPLLPWLLLFFLRSQKKGGLIDSLMAGLAVLVLAPAVNQFPWTISCGLLFIAVAAVSAGAGVYRFSVRRLLVFFLVVGATNVFWIGPLMLDPFLHQAQLTSAVSASGKADALRIIRALAPLMSSADAIGLRNSGALLQAYSHPELRSDLWSQGLWLIGILPAVVIVVGLSVSLISLRKANERLLIGLTGVTLIFLYLQTLLFVPYGRELFELLTQSVPGWTAERNFFDKFAIPMVEILAITSGIALMEILPRVRSRWGALAPLGLSAGMIVYGAPFLQGAEFRQPNYYDVTYTRVMPGLPDAYLSMLAELERLPPGPVLTLPLLRPAWTAVPSDQVNGVYLGISPVYWLTGRSDYNGIDSFASPVVPYLRSVISDDLAHGQLRSFEALLAEFGVRYVVVLKQDSSAREFYRVPAVSDVVLQSWETTNIIADIAPRIIGTFGAFELREVQPDKTKPMLSVISAHNPDSSTYLEHLNLAPYQEGDAPCTGDLNLSSNGSESASVAVVPPSCEAPILLLRQPYAPGWQATFTDANDGRILGQTGSREIYGFANAFPLPQGITNRPLRVTLSYPPATIIMLSALTSGLFLLAICSVGAFRFLTRRRSGRPTASTADNDADSNAELKGEPPARR